MSRSAGPADIQDLLASASSFGLAASRLKPPVEPLTTSAWTRLTTQVRRERQWGPLAWGIAEGWWPASDQQAEQALDAHRASMAFALKLEQRLVELHDACAATGIEIIVLKGSAVAHLDHDEPSLRSFGDIDILVGGSDLARVEQLISGWGGKRRYGEPRPGFDARFSKGLSMRLPDGVEIDVHRTLTLGPFGLRMKPDDLRRQTTTFRLGGAELHALDRRGRFLHACIHAGLGSATPAMTARRDVAAIADPALSEQPLLAAIDLADDWGIGLVPAWAVHDAAATFDWRPSDALRHRIDEIVPSRRDWRWLDGYRDHRSSARHAWDSVQAIDGWRDRARYSVAALAPRDGLSAQRLRRAARDLRHG